MSFFCNATAATAIYTLSLHDALPIFGGLARWSEYGPIWSTWWLGDAGGALVITPLLVLWLRDPRFRWNRAQLRSEEHTSELQSLTNLVCRLLLEKKNK